MAIEQKLEAENREPGPPVGEADIRELCLQFQRAIAALVSSDVAELETSTATQDSLVEKLQSWFRKQPSGEPASITVSASDLRKLINLTKVYSSVLQSALRTTRLRAALCKTYKQHFPTESEPLAASRWSCEA